ncbi:hypothetical protein ACFQMB_06070 [Pseudobowmanella zhangzhouensis]|uniref:hypothetical protein n=1 Tax=Pseudobowmanella zhangzhouensis TaxID=1537679 RepID=UPI00360AC877
MQLLDWAIIAPDQCDKTTGSQCQNQGRSMLRPFLTTIFSLFVAASVNAQSFVPSQAQIEQFKRLPRAQQEMLARQMGINLSDIDKLIA